MEKHLVILEDGYAFHEETQAADRLWTLSLVLPLIVALSALVDLALVFAFQQWFHPWRRILASREPVREEIEMGRVNDEAGDNM